MSAFAALFACSQALAGFVDAPAPRLKLGSDAALRAVSVCTQVDLSLPLRYQPVLQTASTDHDLPIDVRLEPLGGTPLPTGARIIVNDVGQAEVLELTNTRITDPLENARRPAARRMHARTTTVRERLRPSPRAPRRHILPGFGYTPDVYRNRGRLRLARWVARDGPVGDPPVFVARSGRDHGT